ncbi:PREDICTED: disease resistance [Prunus dulcis]|uniref:PREDICTED: disease resistance n=1 Tax=Prunus dulcis TaxID=3755 RepID=A0A5E4FTV8_PRUDU|nr:PREDICTED: disease resistance [Prunus dulcis]
MPGHGKTTLAKKVYNELAIDKSFDKRIWRSTVIVTTRGANIASITVTNPNLRRTLGLLQEDKCWSILKNRVFPDDNAPISADLETIESKLLRSVQVYH